MTKERKGSKLDAFGQSHYFPVTAIDAGSDFLWFALLFSLLGKSNVDLWSS